jgi:hypothetical protein
MMNPLQAMCLPTLNRLLGQQVNLTESLLGVQLKLKIDMQFTTNKLKNRVHYPEVDHMSITY